MTWLTLLLLLPLFVVIAIIFSIFPRHPQTVRRRGCDMFLLTMAMCASIAAMFWGYSSGSAIVGNGRIWPHVAAVLYAYGAFLMAVLLAVWLRNKFWRCYEESL